MRLNVGWKARHPNPTGRSRCTSAFVYTARAQWAVGGGGGHPPDPGLEEQQTEAGLTSQLPLLSCSKKIESRGSLSKQQILLNTYLSQVNELGVAVD